MTLSETTIKGDIWSIHLIEHGPFIGCFYVGFYAAQDIKAGDYTKFWKSDSFTSLGDLLALYPQIRSIIPEAQAKGLDFTP